MRLAEAAGDRVTALGAAGSSLADQLEEGDLGALALGLERYDQAAQELDQLPASPGVPLFRASQELLGGNLEEAERLTTEALAIGRQAHDPVVAVSHMIVLVGLRWEQGRLPELGATLRRFVDRFPASLGWRATLAHHLGLLAATLSRWDEAAAHFDAAAKAHERMGAAPLLARSRDHYERAWRTASPGRSRPPPASRRGTAAGAGPRTPWPR